ncbi:murein hydrolase activator EnvC [Variovorax sp. M-6]|uniref:murein hydrolase activator EnvC family protein n=1 Tax=Variovorax sp. M-6 TaxID=3233041 RepID=UPI003F9A9119
MTGQHKTIIGRATSALACGIACAALIGCATKPSPPPKSAAPAASPSAARPGTRTEPSTQQATRTAKASKPSKPKKAGTRAGSDKPVAAAKVDRNFLRPVNGAVVARYDGGRNKGVDFGGAKGDPVRAAGDGKVVFSAATLRGYGRLVMIKHDATYMSAYAHNSELLVKEGQTVKRGQVIARMGNTETDSVKLHFELRRNGSAVNPLPYFDAGGAAAQAPADD